MSFFTNILPESTEHITHVPSFEGLMVSESKYERDYTIYRTADLQKVKTARKLNFPYKTIFHFFDAHIKKTYNVRLNIYPFLDNLKINQSQLGYYINESLILPDEYQRYWYRNLGSLQQELKKNKQLMRKRATILYHLNDHSNKFKFIIVNHNPLGFNKIKGTVNVELVRFNIYMNNILSQIVGYGKRNIIVLPTTNVIPISYIRELLNYNSFRFTAVRNNPKYMDLLTRLSLGFYLFPDKKQKDFISPFLKIPEAMRGQIDLMFINPWSERTVIINLAKIRKIITQENNWYRFLALLNVIGIKIKLETQLRLNAKTTSTDVTPLIKLQESFPNLTKQDLIKKEKEIITKKLNNQEEYEFNIEIEEEDTPPIIKDPDSKQPNETLDKKNITLVRVDEDLPVTEILKDIQDTEKYDTHPIVQEDINKSKKLTVKTKIEQQFKNYIQTQGYSKDQLSRAERLFTNSLQIEYNGKSINQYLQRPLTKDITTEDIIPKSVKEKLPHKDLAKNKLILADRLYLKESLDADIIANITSFASNGLFVKKITTEDVQNSQNNYRKYSVSFTSVEGKSSTINFKIPMPNEHGIFVVGGIKYVMRRQLVNLPICKVRPNRVALSSNFNKELVERVSHLGASYSRYFTKILDKYQELGNDISYERYNGKYDETNYPLDYIAVGTLFKSITNPKHKLFLCFDPSTLQQRFKFSDTLMEKLTKIRTKDNFTLIGKQNDNIYLFMNNRSNLVYKHQGSLDKVSSKEDLSFIKETDKSTSIEYTTLIDITFPELISTPLILTKLSPPTDYCYMKILNKKIPIIFILSYRFGFFNILKKLNIKFRLVSRHKSLNLKPGELFITFQDFTFIYHRLPLLNSLILNGLKFFNTLKDYDIAELDHQETYYRLCQNKKISINYLKGIDNFFNFFIDPITFDTLKSMGEPTTPEGLLIRSVELLAEHQYVNSVSRKNYRLRNYERLATTIYNEVSRQYAQFVNDKKRDVHFSINTESIFLRIIQDNSVVAYEETNPLMDLKYKTAATHLGFGGRSAESFPDIERQFPEDAHGIISEASPDNSNIALNVSLTPNCQIKNTRGFFEDVKPLSDLPSSSKFSVTALALPGSANDDPKRTNFQSIQSAHVVPTDTSSPGRVRTGYGDIISNLVSETYVVSASQSGKIMKIDQKHQLFTVRYKDGTQKTYHYGKHVGDAAGTYLEHDLVLNDDIVKPGAKINEGDILVYHKQFFTKDPYSKKILWNNGTYAYIAFNEKDSTIEDAAEISPKFAERISFKSVYLRTIKLTADMSIKEFKRKGDEVEYTTPLIKFSYRDIENISASTDNPDLEDELDDILEDLQTHTTKATHSGVVSHIEVYYSCDKKDLDNTIRNFINLLEKENKERQTIAKGSDNEYEYNIITKVEPGTRIKKKAIDEDTIIVQYFITSKTEQGIGDKIVIGNQLKAVDSKIMIDKYITEDGKDIDIIFSSKGLFNRVVLSSIKTGILENILNKAEEEILDIADI